MKATELAKAFNEIDDAYLAELDTSEKERITMKNRKKFSRILIAAAVVSALIPLFEGGGVGLSDFADTIIIAVVVLLNAVLWCCPYTAYSADPPERSPFRPPHAVPPLIYPPARILPS